MKKILYILLLLIAIPVNAEVTEKKISFDSSWTNANKSSTKTGSATLYIPTEKNNVTIAINPYGQSVGFNDFKLTSSSANVSYANSAFANAVKDNLLAEGYQVLMLNNSNGMDDIARIVMANNNADIYIGIEHENKESASGIACKYLKTGNSKLNNSTAGINNKSKELCTDILSNLKSKGATLENQNGERDDMNDEIKYAEIPATSLVVGDNLSALEGTTFASNTSLIADGIINYAKEVEKNSTSGISTEKHEEISFNDADLTDEAKKMLEEVSKSWPSNISKGRVELIKKASSLIGKGVKYAKYAKDRAGLTNLNPKMHDCSSFVSWSFYQSGYSVGLKCTANFITDTENFEVISSTGDFSNIEPGDIILKNNGGCTENGKDSNNHVMIYIGKDSSGQMKIIHSTSGGINGVQYSNARTTDKYLVRYKKWPDEVYTNSNSSSSSNTILTNGSTTDKYKNIFAPLSSNNVEVHCDSILYLEGEKTPLKKFLDIIYVIIKLSVPVITIILSILEYSKSLLDPNNADGKKVTKRLITRIVIGIIIFLLPDILELLFHIFGLYDISLCTGQGLAG